MFIKILHASYKSQERFAGTGVEVVVDEAGGLEEGVADGGAKEFESTAAHGFADGI